MQSPLFFEGRGSAFETTLFTICVLWKTHWLSKIKSFKMDHFIVNFLQNKTRLSFYLSHFDNFYLPQAYCNDFIQRAEHVLKFLVLLLTNFSDLLIKNISNICKSSFIPLSLLIDLYFFLPFFD